MAVKTAVAVAVGVALCAAAFVVVDRRRTADPEYKKKVAESAWTLLFPSMFQFCVLRADGVKENLSCLSWT